MILASHTGKDRYRKRKKGTCCRNWSGKLVWRLKETFQSKPGIEPGTAVSVSEHTTPYSTTAAQTHLILYCKGTELFVELTLVQKFWRKKIKSFFKPLDSIKNSSKLFFARIWFLWKVQSGTFLNLEASRKFAKIKLWSENQSFFINLLQTKLKNYRVKLLTGLYSNTFLTWFRSDSF